LHTPKRRKRQWFAEILIAAARLLSPEEHDTPLTRAIVRIQRATVHRNAREVTLTSSDD
jgi:hypothetical protein